MMDEISNFVADIRAVLVKEWHNRTRYGKIWFPVWLLTSVFLWAIALTAIAIVALFLAWGNALEFLIDLAALTPDTHKDETG